MERHDATGNVRLDLSQAGHWERLTVPYLFERDGLELDKPAIVFE